jgi:hypothetical protein
MLKDKSRVVLLGALVILVLALMGGGPHLLGFHFFHGHSWLRWILFGLLMWLILSRSGCCGGTDHSEDEASPEQPEESEEGDGEAAEEKSE